jgi:hypothetical protein
MIWVPWIGEECDSSPRNGAASGKLRILAEAGVSCDPVRLFVLFAYSVVDGFGGSQAVDRARCGEREQHYRLRDRHADRAAGVYSGESVLYRGVCSQYPVVGEGGGELVVLSS